MTKKLVTAVAIAAWCVLMTSLIELGYIETKALSQPAAPIGDFSNPMKLKGVIRYVTPKQERLDNIAHIGLLGGITIFMVAAFFLRKNRSKNSN